MIEGSKEKARAEREMAALDRLGPLARAALDHTPTPVQTTKIVAHFDRGRRVNGEWVQADLTLPEIDAHIAAFIDKLVVGWTGEPIDAFKLKPRRLLRVPRWQRLRATMETHT